MKIISVVGARPNFMKIAPFCKAINKYPGIKHILVHTGQHYDVKMSDAFFTDLEIPKPDVHLNIGSGTHAEQVGHTMIEFEKVVKIEKPEWIVVVGDVNATCACSIVAKKEHVKVAHIEAGLRSGDIDMPEEVNRLVTDRLSDLLFTPDRISNANLKSEGVIDERIRFGGNIMIDTLEAQREKAAKRQVNEIIAREIFEQELQQIPIIIDNQYAVMTMHRPSNVDQVETLSPIIDFLTTEVCSDMPLLWPIHPRTRKQLECFGLWEKVKNHMILLNPLGYHDMLRLNMGAKIMLTDSGGLQEECSVLGTPCLTLRWNTERPVTLREHGGASVLVGNNVVNIRKAYHDTLSSERKPQRPELWDGHTAERIANILSKY